MDLRWDDAHDGAPSATAYDEDRYLVGQVAFYDVVNGKGPGWLGYVRGERATGRCSRSALAKRLVEQRAPAILARHATKPPRPE